MKLKNLPLRLKHPRQVKEIEFTIRFSCFSQDPIDDLQQKVQYRIEIDNQMSIVAFEVERPSVPEAKIYGACNYVTRFMVDAVSYAMEALVYEACHVAHGTGPNNAELAHLVARDIKSMTEARLKSGVSQTAERRKVKAEIREKYKKWLGLLQAYQTDFKKQFGNYKRQAKRRRDSQLTEREFFDQVWRGHLSEIYSDLPQVFFTWSAKVCRRELTSKEAALGWLSNEYKISESVIDRLYLRPRKRITPYARTFRFEPEKVVRL